jgi:hypothetical protein
MSGMFCFIVVECAYYNFPDDLQTIAVITFIHVHLLLRGYLLNRMLEAINI